MMFRHLLAPIDGSPDASVALDHAIEIAQEETGTIHVLFVADAKLIETAPSVMAPPEIIVNTAHSAPSQAALFARQHLAGYGKIILGKAENRCRAAGIPCKTEYVEGVVVNVILNRAANADLVVLGRRGKGAQWAGPQLGSVLEAIIRHAPTPVLAVQAEVRPLRRILVAFDGSERAVEGLKIGSTLAQRKERNLVVLTVDDGQRERRTASNLARALLADLALPATHRFVCGHAAREILRLATEETCDLITLGSHGYSRFVETYFGSTADEVLHQAICPVLVCR